MKNQLLKLAFEVEIEEGEQLNLPSSIVQGIVDTPRSKETGILGSQRLLA